MHHHLAEGASVIATAMCLGAVAIFAETTAEVTAVQPFGLAGQLLAIFGGPIAAVISAFALWIASHARANTEAQLKVAGHTLEIVNSQRTAMQDEIKDLKASLCSQKELVQKLLPRSEAVHTDSPGNVIKSGDTVSVVKSEPPPPP